MFDLTTPWWEIILRTAVVYVLVLVLLRIAGKRELGQMSPVDLVVILVIANAVQNAMTGGDNSLLGGVFAASTLVASVRKPYPVVGPYSNHHVAARPCGFTVPETFANVVLTPWVAPVATRGGPGVTNVASAPDVCPPEFFATRR